MQDREQNVEQDQAESGNKVDKERKHPDQRKIREKQTDRDKESCSQSVESVINDVLMDENMSEEMSLTNKSSKRKKKKIDKQQSGAKAMKVLEDLSDNDEESEWTQ